MARKKVKLAWITNDSSRRATYKKRKKGLMKKVSELSTLCGVNACAVIYGPNERQPEVWPSFCDAQHILMQFKTLPEMEQSKKMMNQEAFLRQRMQKLKEQLTKHQKENRHWEVTMLMSQCLLGKGLEEVSINDLSDLVWLIDSNMKMIHERTETIKAEALAASKQQAKEESMMKMKVGEEERRATTALEEVVAMEMESLQRQQWFMDVMSPNDHILCTGEEMTLPFVDGSPWLDGCYP
ncbi:hypothetical protein MRB53_028918 [Persea americana]|uniref:Uncharacterized protein n=1 Tax=Persea americana TaxID=3435 RepID=A0ACC2KGW6_PERAE|nr:hypothetical protein MRB53_028918 [Persea americana]